MKRYLLFTLLILCVGKLSYAQAFDVATYLHLLESGKDEFMSYAKSKEFSTNIDTVSHSFVAKKPGCLYLKPYGTENNNENYDLMLVVSTQEKANNKLIIKDAKKGTQQADTWLDDKYLYLEKEEKNPISKKMWYQVWVFIRKNKTAADKP